VHKKVEQIVFRGESNGSSFFWALYQKMNFFVEPALGYDDFLMSLALVAEAANAVSVAGARGSV